jgi:F0F1-type ATP synthase assembly protein I
LGTALRFVGVGWYVASCIVVGVLGGLGLDHLIGTRPLFTLLGVLVGTAAAFYGVYKLVQPMLQENDKDAGEKGGNP